MMSRGWGADIVEMTEAQSPRAGGVGEMGKYVRIWKHGCFVEQSELENARGSVRVVGGGEFSPDPEDTLFWDVGAVPILRRILVYVAPRTCVGMPMQAD